MLRRILLCRLFIDPLSEKILIHFITLYQNDCVDQQVAVVFLHYSSLKYLSYWPKFFSYILLWLGLILFLCFSLTLFQNQRSSHLEKNSNVTIEKNVLKKYTESVSGFGRKSLFTCKFPLIKKLLFRDLMSLSHSFPPSRPFIRLKRKSSKL